MLVCAAGAVAVVALIISDWMFWDRYLHAYSFDSYVRNPFPAADRLYPQEAVPGVSAPVELPSGDPASRSISNEALQAAVDFAGRTHSTSLLVAHNGRIELEKYWLGADAGTPVDSFSMHKTVVALLIGIAISERAIGGVDDPLSKYLDEWAGDARGRITLRQLLQMNSGFEPMQFPRNPFSKHVRRQIGTDLAQVALSFPLVDEPGTVFSYNGLNPTLLVMVLERATGRRYADYLSAKLWAPLGNRTAAVWLDRPGGLARGATSLFAVPRDWLRIGHLLLNRGRAGDRQLVPEDWVVQMTTPSPTNPLYGFLIWIGSQYTEKRTLDAFKGFAANAREPFLAPDIVYLDGLGGQRVYVIPSRDLVIVRTGVLAREWEDSPLPNLVLSGILER
ncbi:MAG: serine hydrolase [Gammaproteobacteria bacterium]|nr:serine hydrolase [Gammaproteobacteria bacterium]